MGTVILVVVLAVILFGVMAYITSIARAAPPVVRRGGCGGCGGGRSCSDANSMMYGMAAGSMLASTGSAAPIDRDHDGIPDNVDPDHGSGSSDSGSSDSSGGGDSGGGGGDSGGGSSSD